VNSAAAVFAGYPLQILTGILLHTE